MIGGTLDLVGFRMGLLFAAGLTAAGGLIGLALVSDPPRDVRAEDCPGGQLAGQPRAAWEDASSGSGRPAAEPAV